MRPRSTSIYAVSLPLAETFRFLHEPIPIRSSHPIVGREEDLSALVDRILYSDGGSFLVTGYRGVGKTTFVNRALAELEQRLQSRSSTAERHCLVDIQLNLAKPLPPVDLMFHIIRCLYSRLRELGLLAALSDAAREEFALADRRTSMTIVRAASEGREVALSLPELELEIPGGVKGKVKSPIDLKKTGSASQQHTYLAYEERAAEYDLIRLSKLLSAAVERRRSWRERWRRTRPPLLRLKIVFVFDELDKLDETASAGTRPYLDDLFSSLKNLFTTSGITFIFVAGKETQDRWVEDIGRGDSVYESIFAYERYLACVWHGAEGICERLFAQALSPDHPMCVGQESARKAPTLAELYRYLTYIGRGIPRRMLRSLNEAVRWVDGSPYLALTDEELTRVEFYSDLQRLLEETPAILGGARYQANSESDKCQLAVYYVLDWVLRRADRQFTAADVLGAANALSTKLVSVSAMAEPVDRLIQALLEWSYIERVNTLGEAQVVDASKPAGERYRLTEEALIALAGIRRREASSMATPVPSPAPEPGEAAQLWRDLPALGSTLGRYRIVSQLGLGGFGAVYRVLDSETGREFALKIIRMELTKDKSSARMLWSEMAALRELRYPGIIQIFDVGEWHGSPYCVMELIDGVTLRTAVGSSIATPALVAYVGVHLARTFQFVHSRGYVRIDIKPENVMLDVSGKLYVLDFGTAVRRNALSDTVVPVGTPAYMAPEAPAGSRSGSFAASRSPTSSALSMMLTNSRSVFARSSASLDGYAVALMKTSGRRFCRVTGRTENS